MSVALPLYRISFFVLGAGTMQLSVRRLALHPLVVAQCGQIGGALRHLVPSLRSPSSRTLFSETGVWEKDYRTETRRRVEEWWHPRIMARSQGEEVRRPFSFFTFTFLRVSRQTWIRWLGCCDRNRDVFPYKHHMRDYSVKIKHWMSGKKIPIMHLQNLRYSLVTVLFSPIKGLKLFRRSWTLSQRSQLSHYCSNKESVGPFATRLGQYRDFWCFHW